MTELLPHPFPARPLELVRRGASHNPADEFRAERRFSVDQRVSVILIEAPEFELSARVRNVSRKGMRLQIDGCVVNQSSAVKISWGGHAIYGSIRHRSQRDGSTIWGVELSSSWDSFLEEVLARHTQELETRQEALQSFSYLASQEMHETLSVVLLYLDLAAKRAAGVDEQTLELIRQAQSGAVRIGELTHDLATYSKVVTEPMNVTPVHCGRLVDAIAASMSEQGVAVTHDRLPVLMGDARELAMVFQCLISNGLKFNRSTERQVHVAAKYKGGEWTLSVADNGIGIDEHAVGRLFQPFSRLHTNCEFPGSGLGLTLTRRIVEKHGGRIWVESQPGAGSTFHFTIPAGAKPWE
jgi:signal transduction histidine kinase